MHISNGASSSAQMLQMAQSLTQSQTNHTDFQAGLNQQQGSQTSSTGQNDTPASTSTQRTSTLGATPASTLAAAASGSMFNTLGNLNSTTNLKDFGLLASQQNMLQQVNLLNQSIHTTQLAALQPATFMQISMVLKLFEQAELKYKQSQHLQSVLGTSSSEAQKSAEESQVLLIAFLERCSRIIEQPKTVAWSRMFKKGPLGENAHEENTDDEYGTVYNDVDAETDYIKRYRKIKNEMLFHYYMLK